MLVLGDSMADWLAYGLEDALGDTPELAVVRKNRASSGLIRYDSRNENQDWAQVIREAIAATKPKFIVMMLGLNDRESIRDRVSVGDRSDRTRRKAAAPAATPAQPAAPAPAAPRPRSLRPTPSPMQRTPNRPRPMSRSSPRRSQPKGGSTTRHDLSRPRIPLRRMGRATTPSGSTPRSPR